MEKEKKIKNKKHNKVVDWILTIVFGGLFAFIGIANIDGMIHKKEYFNQDIRFGWSSFKVETDSMANDENGKELYPVGTAIITYRESIDKVYKDYLAGKTLDISFMDLERVPDVTPSNSDFTEPTTPSNLVMTHRIREIQVREDVEVGQGRYIFITSGTNIGGHSSEQDQFQSFTERYYLGIVKTSSKLLGGFYKFIISPWGLLVLLLVPASYLVIASVLDIFKVYKEDDAAKLAAAEAASVNQATSIEGISDKDKERLKQQLLAEMIEKKKNSVNKSEEKEDK